MSERKFTEGRISIVDAGCYTLIYGPNGERVCKLLDEPKKANSARLVACWNACEGIPTEALQAGVIGEMREALKAALPDMESVP